MATVPVGGRVTISSELWRTDITGFPLEDLTPYVISGSVDWHGDRDGGTPMGCSFTLTATDLVTPYVDFIVPFMNLTYEDGSDSIREQMGIFMVMPFGEEHTPTTEECTIEGRDLTFILSVSKFTDKKNFSSGTNFITNVKNLIDDTALTKMVFPTTTKTLGKAKSFSLGTSRLDAVNHFLHRIGWYKLYMERDGFLRSVPYRSLSKTQPAKLYTEDHLVDLLSVETPPADKFGNVVILQRERTDEATLTSIARASPALHWSAESLGLEIVLGPDTVDDAEDQEALDAIAESRLDNAGAYEKILTFKTMPDPYQYINRTVDIYLQGNKEHLNGRYRLRGWRVGFTPDDALVEIEVTRVARFVTGILEPGQGLLDI